MATKKKKGFDFGRFSEWLKSFREIREDYDENYRENRGLEIVVQRAIEDHDSEALWFYEPVELTETQFAVGFRISSGLRLMKVKKADLREFKKARNKFLEEVPEEIRGKYKIIFQSFKFCSLEDIDKIFDEDGAVVVGENDETQSIIDFLKEA